MVHRSQACKDSEFALIMGLIVAVEFCGSLIPLLLNAVASQHCPQGEQQYFEVEPQIPMVNIPNVKLELFFQLS